MNDDAEREIQRLEACHEDHKARVLRAVLRDVRCLTCLDTRKCWAMRKNGFLDALDGQGLYDIEGCADCHPCGWIACSYTSEVYENGLRLYARGDRNVLNRLEQLYVKGLKEQAQPLEKPVEAQEHPEAQAQQEEQQEEQPPLFRECKRISRTYREESCETETEVGKIIQSVTRIVEAYFGDVFSLVELAEQLTLSFSLSDAQSISHDKIMRISGHHYLGIKTCASLTDQKLSLGFFKGSRKAREYSAEVFILQPLNEAGVKRAEYIMSNIAAEMTEEMLRDFR